MRKFRTEERLKKITDAAKARQYSLRLVMENIHDPHNVSAIFRTCEAVGIPKITLLYTVEQFPKVSKVSSASANKWMDVEKFSDIELCVDSLKKEGYIIYTSMLDKNAVSLFDLDLTKNVALVVGNEHRGVSTKLAEMSDKTFYIPMRGMIQSLNVSVASAVILYEALRQRDAKKMYNQSELTEHELELLIDKWCAK